MATFVNDRYVRLINTVPRYVSTVPIKNLDLDSTALIFKFVDGTSSPASATLTATPLGITGVATWGVSGGTLTGAADNVRAISASSLTGESVTITATIVDGGISYSRSVTIVKVSDGAPANLDPAALRDALEGQISESQLMNALRSRIELVDAAGTGLVDKVGGLQQTYGDTASAATSASNAAGSASSASTSASNAANSASDAGGSATAASGSVSSASTHAGNASNSATAANAAKVAAESARDAAAGSASAASISASTASTKADDAGTSANAASQSANTASTQAGEALTYRNAAAQSATDAQGHATASAQDYSAVYARLNNAGGTGVTVEQSMTATANSITGLSGQMVFKIDNNGHTTGIGIASESTTGTPSGSVIIYANKFGMVLPGQTPKFPFVIGTVAGQTAIGFRGDMVLDGSFTMRKADGTPILGVGVPLAIENAAPGTKNSEAAFSPKLVWEFRNSLEGWTVTGADFALHADTFGCTSSTVDPIFTSPTILLDGSLYDKIRVRVRRLSAGGSWQGQIYYATSLHGYSGSHTAVVPDTTVLNSWTVLEWDMTSLTAGGTDWVTSFITSFRVDLASSAGVSFEIDSIFVGKSGPTSIRDLGMSGDLDATRGAPAGTYVGSNLAQDLETLAGATAKADAAAVTAVNAAAIAAQAKADLAQTTAQAYADEVVTAEEARAIAYAIAKADAAQAAAQTAAAADATAKFNVAEAATALAQADADTANEALTAIFSNNILSRDEKPELVRRLGEKDGEYSSIVAQAAALSVPSTAYAAANTAVNSYLTALSPAYNDLTQNTTIVRADANTAWNNYYAAKVALLNTIASKIQANAAAAQDTANGAQDDAASALAAINDAALGLSSRLLANAVNVLGGGGAVTIGSLVVDSAGNRTGGNGVGITGKGIALYAPSGAPTITMEAATGAVTLAGDISGSTGTFGGSLTAAQVITTGNIANHAATDTASLASTPVNLPDRGSGGPSSLSDFTTLLSYSFTPAATGKVVVHFSCNVVFTPIAPPPATSYVATTHVRCDIGAYDAEGNESPIEFANEMRYFRGSALIPVVTEGVPVTIYFRASSGTNAYTAQAKNIKLVVEVIKK